MQTHTGASVGDISAEEGEDVRDDGLLRPWWRDDPEFLADMERHARREKVLTALVWPLGKVPYIGRLLAGFWFCIFDEGVYATCKPRWGAITFSFLNDGFSPTPWHTWIQLTGHEGPYGGIWTDGAPRDEADAKRKIAGYAAKRAQEAADGERPSD